MVQKRPFHDEELYEVSSKHRRQLEHGHRLVSVLEFVTPEDALQKPHTSGGGGFTKIKTEGDEKLASDVIAELPISTEKDLETSVPGSISLSSLATSNTSEEDARSEAPVYLSFPPEYFNLDRPIRTLVHSEEIYPFLLDYPPQKSVSIGPDHQADIPAWGPQGIKNTSNYLDKSEPAILPQASDSDLTFTGTCVIPMPESESTPYSNKVGDGRTDCSCQDGCSVRCVRQHIMEAREKLRRTLGQDKFLELGFCDMGEVVAEKWSEEEEQLFHKVVFCNPASLDKNFWGNLSIVFPFRTKKDIVSYYFNVFILRRRAEQNRRDAMNIDSDNDEWQGSDDYGDDELGMTDEDEDSVVESPVYQDDPDCNQIPKDDLHEYDKDVGDETCDNNENVDFVSGRGITNISGTCPRKLLNDCSSDPTFQLPDKILWDEGGDQDVQDDSCTSSDTGAAPLETHVKADQSKHWPGSFNVLSSGGGHEYVLEPCDTKVWDLGYLTCPKNEVDFLPTCSMIEEVFGDGAWNYKGRDGKGLS